MIGNIEIYFSENPNTPHNRVPAKNEEIREIKAREQAALKPATLSQVLNHVNEFLMELEKLNGSKQEFLQMDTVVLDGKKQVIINKGIIARECEWVVPVWDDNTEKYSVWENKYSSIQKKFGLKHTRNILWLKFTDSGHLGVVAKGMDINFNYSNTSGRLVDKVDMKWDKSFVIIFPLTEIILNGKNTGDIEKAVGNYLISKGIPIIDFYSHNY
ncbi:MAG: hypothetical protein U0L79_05675 [Lachnospiraceae bacterium]|nr:hypothetical protein [Lachnospiraceae bacterium]